MVTRPDMEYDHDMLERETGTAMGHARRIQAAVGVEHPTDRGG